MTRWTAWIVLHNSWHQFWRDYRRLSPQVWSCWLGTLSLGLGISALITFGITYYAQVASDQWLQAWDRTWLPVIVQHLPLTFSTAITWESPGNLIYMLPLVVAFVLFMASRSRPLLVASMLADYLLQFALVWIGWGYWNRDRPDDIIASEAADPGLHAFPSGHATVVTAVYGLLFYLWLRASRSWPERCFVLIVYVLWTGLVSLARLELGVHWPSDAIAGWIIGLMWLICVIIALHRAEAVAKRS